MDRPTIIEEARRARGLTQAELARRAGTSQSTLSAYERGLKSPSLRVTERLMLAADYDLGMITRVRFDAVMETRTSGFYVPDRLWRVEVPLCFAIVRFPDYAHGGKPEAWNLRRRAERRGLYENVLSRGRSDQIFRWVDGALLVDLWNELDLHARIRRAWDPVVDAASHGGLDFY
ncbi:helix-turn-helix domain-containing protein [Nocardioides sp. NPDC058538]|uniref:helix-turn-helix domain-containing protein n=1 Tax=Nocardioides sp. NPDC058538 TaxID=3346542 RepID=UPI00365E1918